MFGWFKRRREAHKADVEKRILEFGAEQARKRDVLIGATRGSVAAERVESVTIGPVSRRYDYTPAQRATLAAAAKAKPVYTPGGSPAGTYSNPSYDFTPAYVAAAASSWDAGSSSSSDSGSSSSSCDSSSSGCGGGGCGGGC